MASNCNSAPIIWGTSHLTGHLLPLLRASGICARRHGQQPGGNATAARIQSTSDDANAHADYKPMRSYGIAKLAQLMFASSWTDAAG